MEVRPGKKTKFRKVDQEMLDDILKDISEGAPKKHAAEANGLTEQHFHTLVRQGILHMADNIDSMESRLVSSLRAIEMQEIKNCRQNILYAEDGHKGAQWTLEHAYWRSFSNNAPLRELEKEIENMKRELANGKANK